MRRLVPLAFLVMAGCATGRPTGEEVSAARAASNAYAAKYVECMSRYPSTLPKNSESPESIATASRSACSPLLGEFAVSIAHYSNLKNEAESGILTRRAPVSEFDPLIKETCSKLQATESANVVRIVVESRGR